MPCRFSDLMRSMVSSLALRATQQKVLRLRQSASTTLRSSPVMRLISETAVGRSFTSDGNSEGRIDQHRHCQFVAGAIEDYSALGGKRNRAVLLMLGLFEETAVAEYLQINQPSADRQDTRRDRMAAENIERGELAETGIDGP